MKSFKRKIAKKRTKRIKAQSPPIKDINNIIDKIDGGDIYMPKGNDKIQFAKEIANKNAKFQNQSKVQSSVPTRGDYDTLERIETSQIPNATSRMLSRKFGAPEDYIELHVYNLNGQLLQSINEFNDPISK